MYSLKILLGRFLRDLFDLDSAVWAGHQDGPLGRAIEDDAQIELALDLQALLHEHALNDLALTDRSDA